MLPLLTGLYTSAYSRQGLALLKQHRWENTLISRSFTASRSALYLSLCGAPRGALASHQEGLGWSRVATVCLLPRVSTAWSSVREAPFPAYCLYKGTACPLGRALERACWAVRSSTNFPASARQTASFEGCTCKEWKHCLYSPTPTANRRIRRDKRPQKPSEPGDCAACPYRTRASASVPETPVCRQRRQLLPHRQGWGSPIPSCCTVSPCRQLA